MKQKSLIKKGLSVFTLSMINVAAVVSLRGMPAEAVYGLGSIFYYLFAAICFLVPVSLVAAEMTTAYPQKGGVFRWVGQAFSPIFGFIAIFLQWLQNSIWFPTVLTFAAVSIAFIGPNAKGDLALSANVWYTLAVVLGIYWIATIANMFGMKLSGAISKWGTIIGTLIPGAILILLGAWYLISGGTIQVPMHAADLLPNLSHFKTLNLAVSIFLFYAGMEMSAVHIKDIQNPQRNYPRAILIASAITVALFVLGTLALGFVIPEDKINLTQSLLVGYNALFSYIGIPWASEITALFLAVGVFAGVSTWIGGPSKGLLAVGRAGYLPRFLQKENSHGVQSNILWVQAAIVTLLCVFFVLLPSVQSAYQILSAMTVAMYLIMYILMFAAYLKMKGFGQLKQATFHAPLGWFWGILGIIGCSLALFLSYYPPSQIPVGSPVFWVSTLVIGSLVSVAIPIIIYFLRKPDWVNPKNDFEKFTYQK